MCRYSRLGSEVGYQIGQKRVATADTRLLFATCGIALEMLRTEGPSALKDFAFVVLDEVHERSSESDLVLACIHTYMKRELPKLRLVLMSATFDHDRYKRYFADVGEGEAVPRLPVPQPRQTLAEGVIGHLRPTGVRYLTDAVDKVEGLASLSEREIESYIQLLWKMQKRPIADDIVSLRPNSPDTRTIHSLVCSVSSRAISTAERHVCRRFAFACDALVSSDRLLALTARYVD